MTATFGDLLGRPVSASQPPSRSATSFPPRPRSASYANLAACSPCWCTTWTTGLCQTSSKPRWRPSRLDPRSRPSSTPGSRCPGSAAGQLGQRFVGRHPGIGPADRRRAAPGLA